MEFLFPSYQSAARFAAHIARSYKPSPLLKRTGDKFAVVFPERLQAKIDREAVIVATALACLLAGQPLLSTPETQQVLEAIHRSSSTLAGMSDQEVGVYLEGLSAQQLQGFASNVKGIYHELSFVEEHNLGGGETVAGLFQETNHPGADVYFTNDGNVVGQVQLKATDSVDLVQDHLQAYPDIEVVATEEVASLLGIKGSGFSNEELAKEVNEVLQDIMDPSALDQATDLLGEIASGIFALLGL